MSNASPLFNLRVGYNTDNWSTINLDNIKRITEPIIRASDSLSYFEIIFNGVNSFIKVESNSAVEIQSWYRIILKDWELWIIYKSELTQLQHGTSIPPDR